MPVFISKRERMALLIMGGGIVFFLLLQFVVFPMADEDRRLTRVIESKKNTLCEIQRLKEEYDRIRPVDHRAIRPAVGFTLFSFLERLAGTAGIKESITNMKPTTVTKGGGSFGISRVEMKIQEADMARFVRFLQMVETSPNGIYLHRMTIVRSDDDKPTVDVQLIAEFFPGAADREI